MKFSLGPARKTSGDATSLYDVVFHEPCTVAEFVDELEARWRAWGTVYVVTGDSWFDNVRLCEYDHGRITYSSGNDIVPCWDDPIKSAVSHGGWSAYDFYLKVR